MMLKLAVVLFALFTVSQAGYAVFNTFATTDSYCNGTVIASFITTNPTACANIAKRSLQQGTTCFSKINSVNFRIDFFCDATDSPSFPEGWQSVQLTADSNCNATAGNATYFGAPTALTNTMIVIWYQDNFMIANTSLNCGADGVQTMSACIDGGLCINLSLPSYMCTMDALNMNYGRQQTCLAPPVAPVAAPVAPVAAPIKAPVKAPAKASSASVIFASSAILLSLVALI